MNQNYTEKEMLNDALTAQKTATNNFNTYSNECVHENVRDTIMTILNEEHELQQDVFNTMHTKGLYPTPAAEEKKVTEARQKFSQSFKAL